WRVRHRRHLAALGGALLALLDDARALGHLPPEPRRPRGAPPARGRARAPAPGPRLPRRAARPRRRLVELGGLGAPLVRLAALLGAMLADRVAAGRAPVPRRRARAQRVRSGRERRGSSCARL